MRKEPSPPFAVSVAISVLLLLAFFVFVNVAYLASSPDILSLDGAVALFLMFLAAFILVFASWALRRRKKYGRSVAIIILAVALALNLWRLIRPLTVIEVWDWRLPLYPVGMLLYRPDLFVLGILYLFLMIVFTTSLLSLIIALIFKESVAVYFTCAESLDGLFPLPSSNRDD